MRFLRRLYDWVLSWADSPYGVPALFLLAFAESSFFPIPPDILLIALAVAVPQRAFWFALVCLTGSLAGAFVGYGIGYAAWESIGQPLVAFYNGEETMAWISLQYQTYGFWGVLVAAITPIPYKVFTIASGVFRFDLLTFATASLLGRGARFFAVGWLIFKFGPAIKATIDANFNRLAILATVLVVGGFLVLKWLL